MNTLLVWLIATPFIGGLLAWQSERASKVAPRVIAGATMAIGLALSLTLWSAGDYSLTGAGFSAAQGAPTWTFELRTEWIPAIGATFHLGLDGLSILLIVLTQLLGLLAVVCSWREIDRNIGFFHLNLMWNIGGVIGVFLSLDLLLFFVFWEMMLVPMYFLIAHWGHDAPSAESRSALGGRDRVYTAMKFFIYTQASGLLLLVATLALVYFNYDVSGVLSFDYHDLLANELPPAVEWWLMIGFFVAFAVKMPIVPVHGWLPDAHTNAPTAGSVDLAGILLKTAAYGLLRFAIPFFPNASLEFSGVAMSLGVVGIAYGAAVAFAQNDLKRLVAYSSVSHMGYVVIGIYAGTDQALLGVIVQMLAHGLSAAALFILCGEIYERYGTRDLRELGGMWTRLPNLPRLLMFFALAALGLPGLGNFVGEFLVLSGTYVVAPTIAILGTSGLVLSVVYALVMVERTTYGAPAGAVASRGAVADLNVRELAMMAVLVTLLLGLGLYPQPVIDTARAPLDAVQTLYGATR
jgi:NADH-quinone oxidoreductase subunit M